MQSVLRQPLIPYVPSAWQLPAVTYELPSSRRQWLNVIGATSEWFNSKYWAHPERWQP